MIADLKGMKKFVLDEVEHVKKEHVEVKNWRDRLNQEWAEKKVQGVCVCVCV